ncbi:DUF3505 multi-domain protein [Pyrenophora tritici-repentis]|nr:DUF3505 multi-domain protein [Pyrenophora tritici-repentis]
MSKPSIECQYFEHVPEHSVAACRECRYAVWPDQIEGHLQKQHKVSYKEAEAVGQQVRSWAGLVQYPSELEVPTGAPKPVRQLPVYTDGMLCQFDSSCCYYVARSKEAIRKHWRKDHQGWSAGKKRGRPSRTRQKSVQAHMDKGYRLVHCQRLFSSRHGSQYFEVQAPSQDGEGPEIVPVDGAAAWARVGEQMAKAWADIEKRAQTTIQEGERDEVNPWLERTQWLPYLVGMERPDLLACIEEPVAEPDARQEQQAEPVEAAIWAAMDGLARFSQASIIDRIGVFIRLEAIRTEMHQTRFQPLQPYMDKNAIVKHTRPWQQMLMFFARTQKEHGWKSPKYRFTRRQREAWEVLIEQAKRSIEGDEEDEAEDMDEEREELDEEMMDDIDEAIEVAEEEPGQGEGPEPKKLSKIQKACLEFCIALLNHRITRREYDSPLVCALAVLGVKEDGWKGPEQYPPILSAVIKIARFMVVQKGLEMSGPEEDSGDETDDDLDDSAYESGPSQRRRPKGCLQLVQKMMDRFMVRGSHSPMQWMLDLRTYGLKIHYNTTTRGHVEWTNGDELLYKELHFSMAQFRGMVHGLASESRRLLTEELMFSSKAAPVPAVPWESIRDNPTDERPGWNFLKDHRTNMPVNGERWLFERSLTTYLYTIVMEPSTPTSPSPSNIIRLDLTSLTPSPIPTSSPTPILSPTPIQYHESPDEFVQGGITYVKRAIIARKDFRQGTSHIWKYGLQYIRDSDKKEVYYCHECRVGKSKQELFVINGTSRIRNHLEQKHQIDPQSGIKRKGSVRKSIIDQQKDGAASSIFFWKESVEKFKELLIRWIVYCHIAFFQLENQYFRELLLFLNPALLNHLPKAAKTIRSWVMNAFISKKQQLREDLHHSRSRISISFDLWTSPNPYAILGVVAMWIDTTGMRRVTALGMRRIYGEHTGENLGSVVLELLEEYDISGDQIGYFMLDNASANDTAVEFILKDLCPWMKSKQRRHRRLRCLGHVINLCCQAFLMGRNCEKYLAKLEKHHQRGDYTKVEELWKKFGCLGRLHNLVRYIRLTPQRREEFATIIIGGDLSQFDGLELIQNNSTRWNSWFYSITRALNVRERLELFSARHVPGKGSVGIANFKLDGQHWFELGKIELALSKTSMLQLCFLKISETKDHYHDIHTEDDNNFTWKYLQGCADAAWLKCVEYYNNQQLNWQNRFPEDTDLPPAYYAAQILDPYRKWGWFRQEWVLHGDEEKKRWFENAQLAVKHLWETEYKGRYPVEMLPPPARKERDPDPAFDRQREHKRIRIDAPVSTTDLYEQYISTDRLHNEEAGCNEAIAYWLSRYDSQRDLARFALDMFAISPMSDECERLFSSAKLTIVDRRGRLKADIIEACECLRAWYGKPQAEGNSDIEDSENEDD